MCFAMTVTQYRLSLDNNMAVVRPITPALEPHIFSPRPQKFNEKAG